MIDKHVISKIDSLLSIYSQKYLRRELKEIESDVFEYLEYIEELEKVLIKFEVASNTCQSCGIIRNGEKINHSPNCVLKELKDG